MIDVTKPMEVVTKSGTVFPVKNSLVNERTNEVACVWGSYGDCTDIFDLDTGEWKAGDKFWENFKATLRNKPERRFSQITVKRKYPDREDTFGYFSGTYGEGEILPFNTRVTSDSILTLEWEDDKVVGVKLEK